jgi:hypothetical protein
VHITQYISDVTRCIMSATGTNLTGIVERTNCGQSRDQAIRDQRRLHSLPNASVRTVSAMRTRLTTISVIAVLSLALIHAEELRAAVHCDASTRAAIEDLLSRREANRAKITNLRVTAAFEESLQTRAGKYLMSCERLQYFESGVYQRVDQHYE